MKNYEHIQYIDNVKNLLKQVSRVAEYHERNKRRTGFDFNIFSITKIERLEVNTHSAMIVELLDPSGSHGQGDIFLRLFIETINSYLENKEIDKNSINYGAVKISKEKSFNNGSERIDILLEFNDFILLIENKVDAKDGEKQLSRYYDVGKQSNKKFCLLYLTKVGSEASKDSHCGVEYDQISYREDVLLWLRNCIKEVSLVPIVREAILQYLNLVRKITKVSMNSEFKKEMVKLLLEDGNLQYAQIITDSINAAKGEVLFNFFERVKILFLQAGSGLKIVENIDSEFIFTKGLCNKWFHTGRSKSHLFGIFIETSKQDVLLHIEAASQALHYGFVKVKKSTDEDKYIIIDGSIECDEKFKKRKWKRINWYSFIYEEDILSNINTLPQPEKLVEEVIYHLHYFAQDLSIK